MTLTELNLHLDAVMELAEARDSLRSMRESVMRAQTYDAMPHGTGVSDKVGKLAILIATQEDEVARLERIVEAGEKDIQAFINTIPDIRTRTIFRLRFLCGYAWGAVANIGGWSSENAVKATCYRYLESTGDLFDA